MGVKSTVTLSRQDAMEKYVELKIRADDLRHKLMVEAYAMPKRVLEDELESLNDLLNDGEGFENYLIED